ncbi:hypothetical protein ACA910_010257 [Epithemia clementina (nom. ined.)]
MVSSVTSKRRHHNSRSRSSIATTSSEDNNKDGTRLIVHAPPSSLLLRNNNGTTHDDHDKTTSSSSSSSSASSAAALLFHHRPALFGKRPPPGTSIIQPLYYANSDFCNPPAIMPDDYFPSPPPNHNNSLSQSSPSPFLLLVNRGGSCSFIQKVRNAQHMGAAGVLIADNLCVCDDQPCLQETHEMACQPREPILANDGSGNDISIPSFLVFKHDADALKQAILEPSQQHAPLRVEMSFPPVPGASVVNDAAYQIPPMKLDLWMTPTDIVSQTFVSQFRTVLQAFASDDNHNKGKSKTNFIQFQWHLFVMDGVQYGCHEGTGLHCTDLCTNYGRYCAASEDYASLMIVNGNSYNHVIDSDRAPVIVSGADVVAESVRQMCIWSHKGQDQGGLWWAYVTEFAHTCLGLSLSPSYDNNNNKTWTSNHDDSSSSPSSFRMDNNRLDVTACVEHVYRKVGIQGSVINKCVYDSGGLVDNTKNVILEEQLRDQKEHAIYALPTLYVNHRPYVEGPVTASHVLQSICDHVEEAFTTSTFRTSSPPLPREYQLCAQCAHCPDWSACLQSGGTVCPATTNTGVSMMSASAAVNTVVKDDGVTMRTFLSSIVLLVVLVIVVASYHAHKEREQRRQEVRDLVADYILLPDAHDDEEEGGSLFLSNSLRGNKAGKHPVFPPWPGSNPNSKIASPAVALMETNNHDEIESVSSMR